MSKSVLQALREQAASKLLVIAPGVSVEKALASVERAHAVRGRLEGCDFTPETRIIGEYEAERAEMHGAARIDPYQRSLLSVMLVTQNETARNLDQLSRETGLAVEDLSGRPAEDFELAGLPGRFEAWVEEQHALMDLKCFEITFP